MDDSPPVPAAAAKLPWVTPRLERLGSMRDVKADSVQPANDGSISPASPAS